ncbi:hypothetical protein [Streptomyces sp. NPDC003247]|uniref:hypothetical protein n=1 Tax=Streptomyces sp. NPDC003247 TaxID=3364677 RepID=UPI003678BDED
MDKPDFVLVVPRERDGFHLVEQYRYPVGGRFWEFPQGALAEGLTRGEPCREAAEADMVQCWVDAAALDDMVADGRFVDAASPAALALLWRRPRGGRRSGPW